MSWTNISELVIAGVLIAIITGVSKLFIYDNRLYILTWIRRKKLKIFPANFNLAFSILTKDGLNSGDYFVEIKRNLSELLNDLELNKLILIKDFSDIKIFSTKEEAQAFCTKKRIGLIIWGRFTVDSLKKNGEEISDLKLHFTFLHPKDKDNIIGVSLVSDFNSRLAKKNYFRIMEENSHKDLMIVSKNIFDMSTYILGLTLILYGKVEESYQIYYKLYERLKGIKNDFTTSVVKHLHDCLIILIVEMGINKRDYNQGLIYSEQLLKLNVDNFFALSNKAFFQYKTGDKEGTEKTSDKLLKSFPRKAMAHLDVAFINILQKKYSVAYRQYQKLIKFDRTYLEFEPQEVIEFLSDEHEKNNDPAFLYAMGLLSHRYGDKIIAKRDLRKFIKRANGKEYKLMYSDAQKLLKE